MFSIIVFKQYKLMKHLRLHVSEVALYLEIWQVLEKILLLKEEKLGHLKTLPMFSTEQRKETEPLD